MWSTLNNIKYFENLLKNQDKEILKDEVNLKKICRTCLRDTSEMDNLLHEFEIGAMPIKDENGKILKLIDMLESITGLVFDDHLPPLQICDSCVQNVSGAYFFKIQSQKADVTLKKIQNLSNTTEEIYTDQENLNSYHIVEGNSDEEKLDCEPNETKIYEDLAVAKENDRKLFYAYEEVDYVILEYDNGQAEESVKSEQIEQVECVSSGREYLETDDNDDSPTIIKKVQSKRKFSKRAPKSIEQSIKCSQCSEAFTVKKQLFEHIRTEHPNVRAFECTTCNQKFLLYQTLKRHEKIHQADQKTKVCEYCEKKFIRTDDLKRHIRTHTNERPYACSLCPKRYKQTSELKEHQLIHNTETRRIFTCSICKKTLQSRNGYHVHMKTHANIRNHICKICDKKFVTSGELTSHVRHNHDIKKSQFLCDICKAEFTSSAMFNKHCKKFHRNQMLSNENIERHSRELIENTIEMDNNEVTEGLTVDISFLEET